MSFRLSDVSFSYDDRPVIRNLSLELAPGRFIGILGPNGSGKTTLLDLLSGHRRPASGLIEYDGRPLAGYGRKELARRIALVPQHYHINFPFSALEVVMMGRYPRIPRFQAPSEADMAAVRRAMTLADIDHLADRMVSELSGGERQRVVFARALAQETPALLLDEATANLDIRHVLRLMGLMARAAADEGKMVAAVMQDINLAGMFCKELVFMRDGRVVAAGPASEVLTADRIEAVFSVKAVVEPDRVGGGLRVSFVGLNQDGKDG